MLPNLQELHFAVNHLIILHMFIQGSLVKRNAVRYLTFTAKQVPCNVCAEEEGHQRAPAAAESGESWKPQPQVAQAYRGKQGAAIFVLLARPWETSEAFI
jgi:hypothetical protein